MVIQSTSVYLYFIAKICSHSGPDDEKYLLWSGTNFSFNFQENSYRHYNIIYHILYFLVVLKCFKLSYVKNKYASFYPKIESRRIKKFCPAKMQ